MNQMADIEELDRLFFRRHQRFLLDLSNNWWGRLVFGIRDHPSDRKFSIILPNCVGWKLPDGNLRMEFLQTNHYSDRIRGAISILRVLTASAAFQSLGARMLMVPLFAGSVTVFNTSASYVDGNAIRFNGSTETWSVIRAGAGTTHNIGSGGFFMGWNGSSSANEFNQLDRGFCNFNTSVLGAGSTIASATLELYHTTKTTPSDTTAAKVAIHIAQSTSAAENTIANSDFSQIGSTTFGNIAWTSLTGSAYNSFTLNASGLANISLTGASKFSVLTGADIANNAPTTSGSGDLMRVRFQAYNDANKPKLTVTLSTIARTLSESVTYTDALVKQNSRTLSESVTHTSTFSSLLVKAATFIDTVTHTDTMSRMISRTFIETGTFTSTLVKMISRIFSETATFSGTMFRTAARLFSEAVTFTDSILSSFTGWRIRIKPTTAYSNRTKPTTSFSDRPVVTSSWSNRSKPTSSWTDRTPPATPWS